MSKVFELYGHRLDSWNKVAEDNLSQAHCPFMDAECDGGGNRYLSAIDLTDKPELKSKIPNKDIVQCGVCSLQLRPNEQPWIVCPRRLLSAKHGNLSRHQEAVRKELSGYSLLDPRSRHFVWAEVKIKTATFAQGDEGKSFDYTFDYVIAGVKRIRIADAADKLGLDVGEVQKRAMKSGRTLASRNGELWIDDFPADPLVIIEVMTSSTSGGNKSKRTQIAMACEDAILHGMAHEGPGINYRQVGARMASQLIAKSQEASP